MPRLMLRFMLAAAMLCGSLMQPQYAQAKRTPAPASSLDVTQPCSDTGIDLPPCGISRAERSAVLRHYKRATKFADRKPEAALSEFDAALTISPRDLVLVEAANGLRQRVASQKLHQGDQAMSAGNSPAALAAFQRAAALQPDSDYAQQRLHAAQSGPNSVLDSMTIDSHEVRLQPTPGRQNFDFRGSSTELLVRFIQAFGIKPELQQGVTPRGVRLKIENVDWETGSPIVARLCKVLILPMGPHNVLIANDTEENRRDLTRMMLRTFYVNVSTTQQLQDITTALRILFDLRFITTNPTQNAVIIRAPQSTMDAVTSFIESIDEQRPTVVLEVKVFSVSTSFTRDLGLSVPTEFSVFNIGSELRNLENSSAYQQILAALSASGQPVNASTILAALLASASSTSGLSSVLTQPFATFGGGITLSGVTIPATSIQFSKSDSLARTVDQALLRAADGEAATMKVGERYPIITTSFGTSSGTSSLLSSLGLGSLAGQLGGLNTGVPSPQFSYEDLGLVMKATPRVHGELVTVEYEITLRALGTTPQAGGPPIITNRELKGTIGTSEGQTVVIASLMDRNESYTLNGIPGLSMLPLVGSLFSVQTKEKNMDELVITVTPHIVMGRKGLPGAYIPVPMNVPK